MEKTGLIDQIYPKKLHGLASELLNDLSKILPHASGKLHTQKMEHVNPRDHNKAF